MITAKEIGAEFKVSLEKYIAIRAEALYYEAQYNFPLTEEQRKHAHKYQSMLLDECDAELRARRDEIDDKYNWEETEDEYLSVDFREIIRQAHKEACERADKMREANGIRLHEDAYESSPKQIVRVSKEVYQ